MSDAGVTENVRDINEDRGPPRTEDEREQRRTLKINESLAAMDPERFRSIASGGPLGPLLPRDGLQAMDLAKMMAGAESHIPKYLRGNAGGCLAIIFKAMQFYMDPYMLANWSYEVPTRGGDKRVAYESGFFNAIVNAYAPIKARPRAEYTGDGDERRCIISYTLKGETEPRTFVTSTVKLLRKESPLWTSDPDQQLYYSGIRSLAKRVFPELVGGIIDRDDIEAARPDPADAMIVSPPLNGLRERLDQRRHQAEDGNGFSNFDARIEAELAAARGAAPAAPEAP